MGNSESTTALNKTDGGVMNKQHLLGITAGVVIITFAVTAFIAHKDTRILENTKRLHKALDDIAEVRDNVDSLEDLSRQDPHRRIAVLWLLMQANYEDKPSNPDSNRLHISDALYQGIRSTKGNDLLRLLEGNKERVLGFDEDELAPVLANTDSTIEDYRSRELNVSTEFRQQFSQCLHQLKDRYAGSLGEHYSMFELAYPSLEPDCPHLNEAL